MKIYVDYDDCLCETARSFSELAVEMFDKHVPYEKIRYFELDKSFDLDEEQYERFLVRGHEPDVLLSYEETLDASAVINEWLTLGHEVSIITGRPFSAYEPSRKWLDEHGFKNVRLYCLNKYGRDNPVYEDEYSLELEDYYKMDFDFAVEDSPKAFKFFDHFKDLRVLVFDRPWNRECVFPGDNYTRCLGWEEIKNIVADATRR
ncbi:MAG: 2-dehydropantoate 2-reductase [Lachnospiraceae bacterium]|nr:2-dehydropantoate 2-reductase [Lachnospiraceae bacterium]